VCDVNVCFFIVCVSGCGVCVNEVCVFVWCEGLCVCLCVCVCVIGYL